MIGGSSWPGRFWQELGRPGNEPELFVRLIIVERIAKAVLLIVGAVALIILGHEHLLVRWAAEAQSDLNLDVPAGLFQLLLDQLLVRVGFSNHVTAIASGVILFALVEGAEGVGLALRRRWAEYLVVLATGFLIPYELWEVIHRPTLFRIGALVLNVVIVAYLAYRKRLFVDV